MNKITIIVHIHVQEDLVICGIVLVMYCTCIWWAVLSLVDLGYNGLFPIVYKILL